MPGTAARSAGMAAAMTGAGIRCLVVTASVPMSYASAPFAQMAVPTCPNIAAMSRITRGGRPVTSTNRAPAASTRANAATVRSEIVPSERTIVPSRSVATSNGKSPTSYEPNRLRPRRDPVAVDGFSERHAAGTGR